MDTEVKDQIIRMTNELFTRYGIKSVSMDDIARALGMSKKTIYQYVDNKADLIRQIVDWRREREEEEMNAIRTQADDAIDEILQIGRFVIRQLRKAPPTVIYDLQKYYAPLYQELSVQHGRYLYSLIRGNLERGMAQGLYRSNLNPDIIAKLFVGKSRLVGDDEHFPLQTYPLEQLFKQHLLYHIYGVASPQGLELLDHHLSTTSKEMT